VYAFNTNGVGNIGDKLYFSGGKDYGGGSLTINNMLWVYDPATNALTRKADMPFYTADGVTAAIDDMLYVLPGTCSGDGRPPVGFCEHEPIRTLFRYNPSTDTWVKKKAAPHYHRNGAGGAIQGKFYVAGGLDDRLAPTRHLDVYDPATNTWKTLARLPTALDGVAGAVMQGQLFVIGYAANGAIKHYAYSPTSNTWKVKAAPSAFGGPAAKVFLDGTPRLLLLRGATFDYGDASQIYTP
jgi:N-acetylneuraminic acid mutarotase